MKCLSLWNPWSHLLVTGKKCVETRSWNCTYRGSLLIHAGKRWVGEMQRICLEPPFRNALAETGIPIPAAPHSWTLEESRRLKDNGFGLAFGAIIGRVDVVGCFPTDEVRITEASRYHDRPILEERPGAKLEISSREQAFGDYTAGRYAILCACPVRFPEPIFLPGMQGIFEVDDDRIPEQFRGNLSGVEYSPVL